MRMMRFPSRTGQVAPGGQATRGSDSGLARCSGPRSKAAVICAKGVGDALPSEPIAGIVDSCARATNGHEAVASPSNAMNSRRLMSNWRLLPPRLPWRRWGMTISQGRTHCSGL